MKQGQIWLVGLDPVVGREQAKTRPCVIISRDALNDSLDTVIVAPITSSYRGITYPNIVPIGVADGLSHTGTIKLEQIRCVDKSRLKKKNKHSHNRNHACL